MRVFERTKVTALENDGAGVRVCAQPAASSAHARRSSPPAPTRHHLLPRLRFRFIPFYDYIIVSEPLTAAQREVDRLEESPGRGRRPELLQVLPADGRRPRPLGHERGRSTTAATASTRAATIPTRHYSELRDSFFRTLPRPRGARLPLRLGRRHLRHDALHAVLRLGARRARPVRPRLHGPRPRHDAPGRPDPRPHGARPAEPAPRPEARAPEAVPLPPEPLRSLAVEAVTQALRRVDAGERPNLLLRALDALGIGLSS